MEKIEVGEYVRTKNGKIRTVKSTVAQYYITDRLNISDNNQFTKEDIVKHSKNIIDLLEVGDYANGHLIIKKGIDGDLIIDNGGYKSLFTIDIKSIVTHEQFESMEYKV